MRRLVALLSVCLAGTAFAQTTTNSATTTTETKKTVEIGYGGRNGTTTTTNTATSSTTTPAAPTPVAAAATAPTPATPTAATPTTAPATPGAVPNLTKEEAEKVLESVGYDPKAKRDPNGKLIDEATKTPSTPEKQQERSLRSDKKLRSDSDLLPKKPEPKPVSINQPSSEQNKQSLQPNGTGNPTNATSGTPVTTTNGTGTNGTHY